MAQSINRVFRGSSTFGARPTNGRQDATASTLAERLDAALAAAGLDNAAFAARLGDNGQQLVHNWRRRGTIGRDSYPAVRRALPGIVMDWLNDNVGEAPFATAAALNPDTVAEAFALVAARFTRANLAYSPVLDPDLLVAAIRYVQSPSTALRECLQATIGARIAQRHARQQPEPVMAGYRGVERRAH